MVANMLPNHTRSPDGKCVVRPNEERGAPCEVQLPLRHSKGVNSLRRTIHQSPKCIYTTMALQGLRAGESSAWKKLVLLLSLVAIMWRSTLFLVSFWGYIAECYPATASSYQGTLGLERPDDWGKYVQSPARNIVSPVAIVSNYTQGNITNVDGLLTGQGVTTLTRNDGDTVPTIVVDFGRNIVGFLSIQFGGAYNSTPGNPSIRLAFSETLEYLTNVSDFSRSDNVSS